MTTKQRSQNQRQEVYCARCERITFHTVNDPNQPSEWVKLPDDIRAYKQYRECTECEGSTSSPGPVGYQWTVELREDDFKRIHNELKALREFRESVQSALAAVEA